MSAGEEQEGPGEPGGNAFERMREQIVRRHPELDKSDEAIYDGWLVGFLEGDLITGTATGIRVEHPERGTVEAGWEPGRRCIIRQLPELDGAWTRCLPVSRFPWDPPEPEAVLVTSPARYGDDTIEPASATWVPGTDGIGPSLRDTAGEPVRWLLLDGYVYDVRADQDHPPYERGRWAVNEWRPKTMAEMATNPFEGR